MAFGNKDMNERYLAQIERAQRTKSSHPYFLLTRGPYPKPCPIHGKDEGLVLPVDNEYWIERPMKEHPECKCHVRAISKREYEKIKIEGVPDPDAPTILNDKGLPAGRKEIILMQIKETPS